METRGGGGCAPPQAGTLTQTGHEPGRGGAGGRILPMDTNKKKQSPFQVWEAAQASQGGPAFFSRGKIHPPRPEPGPDPGTSSEAEGVTGQVPLTCRDPAQEWIAKRTTPLTGQGSAGRGGGWAMPPPSEPISVAPVPAWEVLKWTPRAHWARNRGGPSHSCRFPGSQQAILGNRAPLALLTASQGSCEQNFHAQGQSTSSRSDYHPRGQQDTIWYGKLPHTNKGLRAPS